ncbi:MULTISPECIES: adenine deaminase [unclassified Bacillus (in: firmicutes)]|uniref:adenine deaminase n=1 Tax=unclassified Bacillus (in: firmicutes) TaxID=185979 RepID=UPI0008F319D5|nr:MULTISPECIES: adenine deaminase [unclassified Bacillus (in: firmicutes)]SFB02417.1 Adenine deaminase [Bacillus sp. UNCCL13]SFQ89095.1 Adenine deaminase [Bacillus sp. cl95]
MNLNRISLKRQILTAAKNEVADVVIKNGKIIDVFNLTIFEADIAITDGVIVGLGNYDGKKVIDVSGKYVCPGFIDGHVHIESAMVTPAEFAKVVLPHGVTTIIADPHEIGNVAGAEGIQFMIDHSKNLPLSIYYMLPSCVPATPFENAGAVLRAEDLAPFYEYELVLGLGEVMDYPSVAQCQPEMMNKLSDALERKVCIDGHAAGIDADGINVYMTSGIRTDHECVNAEEVIERLQRGMYVMLREGSAARDLKQLIKAVNEKNARRCLFVTDDKHLDDLLAEGSIDYNVKLAIAEGLDPILVIQMATLNAAECFGLRNKGAIAPSYDADLLILDSLDHLSIESVFQSGNLVAEKGACLPFEEYTGDIPNRLTNSVQIENIVESDLLLRAEEEEANIIEVVPNSLVTKRLREGITVENGFFQTSITNDQLKMAVVERHHQTGNIGMGIVKGFGIKSGALASTVAHDSHNIVVAGTNDQDMFAAIIAIEEMNGGLVVINDGKVIASLPLNIAGLISNKDYQSINNELNDINAALEQIGFSGNFNPFLTLSFLALPVIPQLKLTDMGLFDVERFRHIGLHE